MKTLLLLSILLFLSQILLAQSPVGRWKTVDDETGETKSIVEFYLKNDKLYGKIAEILVEADEANPVCVECPEEDDRYKQPIKGLEIIRDLEKNGNEWTDGTVLDPENGKVYSCKIWLEGDEILKLRGYVAFFYRTQIWKKAN